VLEPRRGKCVRWTLGVLLVSVCTPVGFAGGDGELVVQVDSWSLSPEDTELDFAVVEPPDGVLQTLEPGRVQTPRFYAGWRFGTASALEVGMSVWQYEDGAQRIVPPMPDTIGTLLASPALPIEEIVDSATAVSETRATAVDLDLRWPRRIGKSSSRFVLRAGVRLFRFEERSVVTYLDQEMDFFGATLDFAEFVNTTGDTSGIGPRVGLEIEHAFSERLSLGGGVGASLPIGKIEGLTTETVTVDDDGPRGQNPDLAGVNVVERSVANESFLQLDAALRFEIELGRGWTATVGYVFERWDGARIRPRLVAGPGGTTLALEEGDVEFHGASLGIRLEY
jgi:hypothetical protein